MLETYCIYFFVSAIFVKHCVSEPLSSFCLHLHFIFIRFGFSALYCCLKQHLKWYFPIPAPFLPTPRLKFLGISQVVSQRFLCHHTVLVLLLLSLCSQPKGSLDILNKQIIRNIIIMYSVYSS